LEAVGGEVQGILNRVKEFGGRGKKRGEGTYRAVFNDTRKRESFKGEIGESSRKNNTL